MDLQELLRRKRAGIVKQWIDETLAVYPAEAAKFLRETRDRFANPAGRTISEGIEFLYDALASGESFDARSRDDSRGDSSDDSSDDSSGEASRAEIESHLTRIVQITCIQGVSASRAVEFVFRLKDVLRRELESERREPALAKQHLELESRIDRLALIAFDSFAEIQRRLADIRVREVQGRVSTLRKMAQLNWEDLPTGEWPCGGSG